MPSVVEQREAVALALWAEVLGQRRGDAQLVAAHGLLHRVVARQVLFGRGGDLGLVEFERFVDQLLDPDGVGFVVGINNQLDRARA